VFRKILVANRGEIALRILRTLQEMGIAGVTVASEADRSAPHFLAAAEGYVLGPAPAASSYLRIDRLLEVARTSGCDALHPGYGFLSENPALAEACEEAGVAFIGPSPAAMRVMGSKTASRAAMEKAGVPVVPGFQGKDGEAITDEALTAAAERLGWPLLVKAAAGGGGKGMRVVADARELRGALAVARSEAEAAFGDPTIYLEKYLVRPRHIEIQVFGDASGGIHVLGERECSLQRRHQKILEESPSPGVDADLRRRMSLAAVAAARAVGYRNAGTVEFLLDAEGDFHFLEMNTRLQVEHAVTEMLYGIDLVAAQILTAAGEPLPFDPRFLCRNGHAIEARVYAEDPAQGFLPQAGRILALEHPVRPGVRIDSALALGTDVTVHYDPLLAKVIAWGADRDAATARLRAALADFTLLGVTTNLDFLSDVLELPAWREGRLHTGFLEEHLPRWSGPGDIPVPALLAAAEIALSGEPAPFPSPADGPPASADPWTTLGGWRPLEER
jgi:acetyl/propionyl-CoA carboxylase alpha subunit